MKAKTPPWCIGTEELDRLYEYLSNKETELRRDSLCKKVVNGREIVVADKLLTGKADGISFVLNLLVGRINTLKIQKLRVEDRKRFNEIVARTRETDAELPDRYVRGVWNDIK